MATLTQTHISFGDTGAQLVFTPATGSDRFVPDNADGRVFLLARNGGSGTATVTLKAGDGALSVLGDLSLAVAAGGVGVLPLSRAQSARVKVLTGAERGSVGVAVSVLAGQVEDVSLAVLSVE